MSRAKVCRKCLRSKYARPRLKFRTIVYRYSRFSVCLCARVYFAVLKRNPFRNHTSSFNVSYCYVLTKNSADCTDHRKVCHICRLYQIILYMITDVYESRINIGIISASYLDNERIVMR